MNEKLASLRSSFLGRDGQLSRLQRNLDKQMTALSKLLELKTSGTTTTSDGDDEDDLFNEM